MTSAPCRVIVVHDDPVIAAGLCAVLGDAGDLAVEHRPRAGCDDGGPPHEALRAAQAIVADHAGGLALLRDAAADPQRWRGRVPNVLVYTPLDREVEVRDAIRAGVRGYLLQGAPAAEIIAGARLVAQGARHLSDAVGACVADSLVRDALTHRESEVMTLVAQGLANKAIAHELRIATSTVKAHVRVILEKLDATSRTHAVAVAARRGLVQDEGARWPAPAAARARPAALHGNA